MMLPVVDDRETAPFFACAAQDKLCVKACRSCGRGIHPPVPHCPYCGSADTYWRDVSGTGTLYAWSTVMHQVHPDFPTPYTIVVVQLDDVPEVRLVGHLEGQPELRVRQPMQVCFNRLAEGVVLPNWRPAAEVPIEGRSPAVV
jgi:uncharacterized OB-fold protein